MPGRIILLLSVLLVLPLAALKYAAEPYAVPNPFRASIVSNVEFVIPESGERYSRYRLADVYSASGVCVRRLRAPWRTNAYRVLWDGLDREGKAVDGGLYFILVSGGYPPPLSPGVFSLLLIR